MQITKAQFKANFEHILNSFKNSNEEIIIIENGEPIFQVSKYQKKSVSTEQLFASLRGKVKYSEDLTSPTTEEWSEV